MNIIFFGTSDFAQQILEKIYKEKLFNISLIVTKPDQPVGRKRIMTPSIVKQFSIKNKLPFITPSKISSSSEIIALLKDKTCIPLVVEYGIFIPSSLIKKSKYGFVNIHPSLLPKYRGPSPIQSVLLNGEKQTGTSLMLLDDKMDHGPIISQASLKITDKHTFKSLRRDLINLSFLLLKEKLPLYFKGKLKPKEQDHSKASFCKLIKTEDAKINWNDSVRKIFNKIRALEEKPVAWTFTNQHKRIKIFQSKIFQEDYKTETKEKTGKILYNKNQILVVCQNGLLEITKLQIEGKQIMSAREFINGYKDKILFFIT